MADISEDFEYRSSLLMNLTYNEAGARISGFYDWLMAGDVTREIVDKIELETDAAMLLEATDRHRPPKASSPEEIASVGILLMRKVQEGVEPHQLASRYGIEPGFSTNSLQDYFDSVFDRFMEPTLEFIGRELRLKEEADSESVSDLLQSQSHSTYPLEIHESLGRFLKDHPEPRRNAFIMMQFGSTKLHEEIISAVRDTLSSYGIAGHRADDKEYNDDLFGNVLTYLHGCSFGIAVFERLEADDFNPNVSLEVGYMRALGNSVCLLKDTTLATLQTDLVGKLYKAFDPQDPGGSIPALLEKWLRDKDII